MDKSVFIKAEEILAQKLAANSKIEQINNALQADTKKEFALLEDACLALQDHYRDKLIKYTRLLLEKNKQELQELIKCLDVEFDNL